MKGFLFKLLTILCVAGLIYHDKQKYAEYKATNQPYQQILDDQGETVGRVTQVEGGTVAYAFEAEGRKFQGKVTSDRYGKEAQVPVSYCRKDPANNVIGNPRSYMGSWGSLAFLLGLNAAVLALAVVLLAVG